uniref:Uncharacterized protein n=1 Tax=Rhodnius prolixus TaxID=13249 RepID=T1H9U7_RHOPR
MKKTPVLGLFIDFQKAFDSLSHVKLWDKLRTLGVSAKFLRIMINFYNEAKIKLDVNGA